MRISRDIQQVVGAALHSARCSTRTHGPRHLPGAACVGIQAEARSGEPSGRGSESYAPGVFDLPHSTAELWCLSDLLEHLPNLGRYQSSTEKKALYISKVFRGETPGLVMGTRTAGSAETASQNGCVVVGTKIFMHDPNGDTPNPDSRWNPGLFDRVLDSSFPADTFNAISTLPNAQRSFL